MMRKLKRIKQYKEGENVGNLIFIKELEEKIMYGSWMRFGIFKCFCGNEFECFFKGIKRRKDCGCSIIETNRKSATVHGLRYHKYYNVAKSARDRCYNKNNTRYNSYGGRGISLYSEWINNIPLFIKLLENNLPERKHGESIDRIDVNGNYEPGNLRRASNEEQANNKTNNFKLKIDGRESSLSQLSRIYNLSQSTIKRRHERGLRGDELFTIKTPATSCRSNDKINIFGVETTYKKIVTGLGIPRGTMYEWVLKYGISGLESKIIDRLGEIDLNSLK